MQRHVPEEGILQPHRCENLRLSSLSTEHTEEFWQRTERWQRHAVAGHCFPIIRTVLLAALYFDMIVPNLYASLMLTNLAVSFWIYKTQWTVTEKRQWYYLRALRFSRWCGCCWMWYCVVGWVFHDVSKYCSVIFKDRNVGSHSSNDRMSHHRRLQSSDVISVLLIQSATVSVFSFALSSTR